MTQRASTGSTVLLLLIAWGCGIGGILWAYLLALAGASSTVPQMSVSHMLMTLPLPILAGLTAWFVIKRARSGAAGRGFMWAAIPGMLFAALGLFIGLSAYFNMT